MTYRYSPGNWFGVVTAGGVALLPKDLRVDVVEAVWARLEAGDGLGAVLDALTGAFGTSLAALPPFAVMLVSGEGVQLAVRGELMVEAIADGGAVSIHGTGVSTWAERRLEGVSHVRVAAADAHDDAVGLLPINSAVVLCDVVTTADAFELSVVTPATPAAAATPPVAAESTPSPVDASRATGESDAQQSAPEATAAADVPDETLIPEATRAVPVPTLADAAASPGMPSASDAQTDYDELFGATVVRSVEDAAVRPDESATESDDAPAPAAGSPEAVAQPNAESDAGAAVEPASPEPAPEPESDESFYISGIPDFSQPRPTVPGARPVPTPTAPRAASAVAPAVPDLDVEGDHDGATVSVEQLRAMRAARAGRVAPRAVAVLSTGERFTLDRGLIVGRRPRVTRVTGEVPNLATVPSPDSDISRNHLELRVEGDTVLAVDLNTTNGSHLRRPGAEPVRLHPGEPTIVVPGDELEIGDGVTITIEGPA